MRKPKRGVLVSVVITFLCLTNIHICFAGDINSHEAKVIAAANGTFEYDGVTYRAKSSYKAQLAAKLSEDGVDLTAEQSENAIAMMYANVAAGVEDGYLEPTGGKKNKKHKDIDVKDKHTTDGEEKKETDLKKESVSSSEASEKKDSSTSEFSKNIKEKSHWVQEKITNAVSSDKKNVVIGIGTGIIVLLLILVTYNKFL